MTAPDLLALEIIDEIIKEPVGGAHLDYDQAAALVDDALSRHLAAVRALPAADRLTARYAKFRDMGRLGQSFVDDAAGAPAAAAVSPAQAG
jgi:acetyl-CoA carboxylase carboxyl transferase subunit alpha